MTDGLSLRTEFVVETELLDHAGTVILQHHVGLLRQPLGDRHAFRLLEVERDAALAAVQDHGGSALVFIGLAHRPAPVAGGGRLHLDHVGAVLSQQHPAIGRGDALGHVEHLEPVEGEFVTHSCISFRSRSDWPPASAPVQKIIHSTCDVKYMATARRRDCDSALYAIMLPDAHAGRRAFAGGKKCQGH